MGNTLGDAQRATARSNDGDRALDDRHVPHRCGKIDSGIDHQHGESPRQIGVARANELIALKATDRSVWAGIDRSHHRRATELRWLDDTYQANQNGFGLEHDFPSDYDLLLKFARSLLGNRSKISQAILRIWAKMDILARCDKLGTALV